MALCPRKSLDTTFRKSQSRHSRSTASGTRGAVARQGRGVRLSAVPEPGRYVAMTVQDAPNVDATFLLDVEDEVGILAQYPKAQTRQTKACA